MTSEFTELEASLRGDADRTGEELQRLEQELEAFDAQLEALVQDKRAFDVLSDACRSLEELDALDAGRLFWGEGKDAGDRIADARQRVEAYNAEVTGMQLRRQEILDRIGGKKDELDDLHFDIENVLQQEERRRNNWVIEREPDDPPNRFQVMPWARGCEEDRRFRRTLAGSLLASFVVGVIVHTVVLPVIDDPEVTKIPERVARLVREQRVEPPPPEPVEEPSTPPVEPEPQDEPEPEPEAKPKPEPARAAAPTPTPGPAPAQPDATSRVANTGILAFRDDFASRANVRPNARIGAQARISSAGANAVARQTRSMVTRPGTASSGGINLDSISRNVGGGGGQGIDGVRVARVSSSIGGGGGPDRPLSGGAAAGRTDEEIQIVFDRYKAALYRLYNRELRKDPTLRGQVVLRLTIEPDGSVSMCELQSSAMNAPTLAQQIVGRVRTFDFGAKDVAAMTIIYPIDFLPAA